MVCAISELFSHSRSSQPFSKVPFPTPQPEPLMGARARSTDHAPGGKGQKRTFLDFHPFPSTLLPPKSPNIEHPPFCTIFTSPAYDNTRFARL